MVIIGCSLRCSWRGAVVNMGGRVEGGWAHRHDNGGTINKEHAPRAVTRVRRHRTSQVRGDMRR